MKRTLKRALTAAGICAAAAAIALIAGAVGGSASPSGNCTPPESSRHFCVTVEDTDGVSVSGVMIPGTNEKTQSYLAYTITVQNTGASGSLTNGVVTAQLTDSDGNASTAAFQASPLSPAFCKLTSKSDNIVTCSIGNLAATTSVTFTVGYTSSTTEGIAATNAHVITSFKEMLKGDPKGANVASIPVDASTSYASGDSAGSWSPTGKEVRLETDTTDTQWSALKFSNLLKPAFVASLQETNVGPTVNCHPDLKACFGQNVHVGLNCGNPDTCAISATNFGFVQINIVNPDPGLNANTVVASHKLEDGTFELIRARCTSEPPDAGQVPCLTATMTRLPGGDKLLTVNVWFKQNGDVRVG